MTKFLLLIVLVPTCISVVTALDQPSVNIPGLDENNVYETSIRFEIDDFDEFARNLETIRVGSGILLFEVCHSYVLAKFNRFFCQLCIK